MYTSLRLLQPVSSLNAASLVHGTPRGALLVGSTQRPLTLRTNILYPHVATSTLVSLSTKSPYLRFPVTTTHVRARLQTHSSLHTYSRHPFANVLPSELRILRGPESSKPIPKEAKAKEEKETTASRAVELAKEQALKDMAEGIVSKVEPAKQKLPISVRIKEGLLHYWHGTKLFGLEFRISSKLLLKLLRGKNLTRRELRQLRRTTSDLLRLVPFLVFLIVPFLEILLPVALKLFPNMLPSTFEDKLQAEEKRRRLLKVRVEMAKFLQETIAESGIPGTEQAKAAKEFAEFFRKIRTTGEQPTTEDILRVAKLFGDDLTLDNLTRPQLVSMCRYMGINAFGTDNFLRYQIRNRMSQIKADDRMILAEGVDALTTQELQAACASRGIRTHGISPARLRSELEQWLELHLKDQVPSTLLILSRAFSFTDRGLASTQEALQAALQSLPDTLIDEAELQVLEAEGASTYKDRLEVVEQQQELIEDEQEQEEKEETARRAAKEAKEAEERARKEKEEDKDKESKKEKEDKRAKEIVKTTPGKTEPQPEPELLTDEELARKKETKIKREEEHKLSEEQLQELRNALALLISKKDVLEERERLNEVREDHEDYKEDVQELAEATKRTPSKDSLRLGYRLEKMINRLDKELAQLESDTSSSFPKITPTAEGQITTADLEEALRIIRHTPDNNMIKKIVEDMDIDKDGLVFLKHIGEIAEMEAEGLGVLIENIKEGERTGSLRSEQIAKSNLPKEMPE